MELLNTPALETERLILRKFCADDIAALFSIFSDEEVNMYLPWFPLSSLEEAERLFIGHCVPRLKKPLRLFQGGQREPRQIGRASCRERVLMPV